MDKLVEALHVIQDECKENEGCRNCPMIVDGVCGIMDTEPCDWRINDEIQKALL